MAKLLIHLRMQRVFTSPGVLPLSSWFLCLPLLEWLSLLDGGTDEADGSGLRAFRVLESQDQAM
jgi:hypothetical protein